MSERRVPCPSCGARIVEGGAQVPRLQRGGSASATAAPWGRSPAASRAWREPRPAVSERRRGHDHRHPDQPEVARRRGAAADRARAGGRRLARRARHGADDAPDPAAFGPDAAEPAPPPAEPKSRWRAREFRIGDVHPLDVVFNPSGASIYVSADDASLREYKLQSGELIHKASMPAQGDHIRLLFDRYVAVLRHEDAARIPVMDTTALGSRSGPARRRPDAGRHRGAAGRQDGGRGDDGHEARDEVRAADGVRLANITLPHATGRLFLVQAEGRPYIAALGALTHAGRPAGAWIDLFDPSESPFGATRRASRSGASRARATSRGMAAPCSSPIGCPTRRSLLSVAGVTETRKTPVGVGPTARLLAR